MLDNGWATHLFVLSVLMEDEQTAVKIVKSRGLCFSPDINLNQGKNLYFHTGLYLGDNSATMLLGSNSKSLFASVHFHAKSFHEILKVEIRSFNLFLVYFSKYTEIQQ